ncbi:MAG TPA: hypothetical protein VGB57_04730 [Allosphingosinicella sp.]|jgi:hypothetical protein
MKLACLALLSPFALVGCWPTTEMRDGSDRVRLVEIVRQFCAAERSADPGDTHPLLVKSLREMLDDGASVRPHLTSADPKAGCEPGRTWYLGGSRMFAEVRLGDRSDRLDLWRGEWPRIGDVIYGRKRQVGGRRFKSLRAELIAEAGGQSAAAAPPPPPPPDMECLQPDYRFAFVGTDTIIYRQGAAVRVTPMVDRSPAGTAELPLRCTSGWSVIGPATLSADRTSITIAPDAPAGATITIGFRHEGKAVEKRLKVVAKDEVVLTGRYTQRSLEGCSANEPVRELEFRPENRFSVTFLPFETYQDYWGTYSFDPATRRLRLTVEGGNFIPSNLDPEGEAELADGRLRLTGLFLGSRHEAPQSNCTYVF